MVGAEVKTVVATLTVCLAQKTRVVLGGSWRVQMRAKVCLLFNRVQVQRPERVRDDNSPVSKLLERESENVI